MNAPQTQWHKGAQDDAAEKAARWQLLLAENRAALREIIKIAVRHPKHWTLRAHKAWAVAALHELDREAADPHLTGTMGSIGRWGKNGHGPRIASTLSSARFWDAQLSERIEG